MFTLSISTLTEMAHYFSIYYDMRKVICISLSIFISACNERQPECNNEQVKSLVVEVYNIKLPGKKEFSIMVRQLDLNFDKNIIYKAQITDDKENIAVDVLALKELREAIDKFTVLYICNELAVNYFKKHK